MEAQGPALNWAADVSEGRDLGNEVLDSLLRALINGAPEAAALEAAHALRFLGAEDAAQVGGRAGALLGRRAVTAGKRHGHCLAGGQLSRLQPCTGTPQKLPYTETL